RGQWYCFCCTYTALPGTYPLSLHDALPISSRRAETGKASGNAISGIGLASRAGCGARGWRGPPGERGARAAASAGRLAGFGGTRSEEHTSELQSRRDLVCRLLLEKKKHPTRQAPGPPPPPGTPAAPCERPARLSHWFGSRLRNGHPCHGHIATTPSTPPQRAFRPL